MCVCVCTACPFLYCACVNVRVWSFIFGFTRNKLTNPAIVVLERMAFVDDVIGLLFRHRSFILEKGLF